MSIEDVGGGRWRVGVHIADVSFFIPPGSALDKKAADRANSTYMIQEVIHMLPRLLCEELCSLKDSPATVPQQMHLLDLPDDVLVSCPDL